MALTSFRALQVRLSPAYVLIYPYQRLSVQGSLLLHGRLMSVLSSGQAFGS